MSNLAQVFEAVEILEKHNFSKDEAQRLIRSFESVSTSKEDLMRTEANLKEDLAKTESNLTEKISSVKQETLLLRQEIVKLENKLLS